MTTQTLCTPTPIVSITNNSVTTLSIDVASFFGKRHSDVLRSIKSLISQIPNRLRIFAPTVVERENPSGGAPVKSPAYSMSRDGFTLLAMGFTGPKALLFKIAYIEAFNRMEAQLRGTVLPSPLITPAQQLAVRNAIAKRAKDSSVAYQTIYHALYTRFQIAKYDQLKSSDFDTALKFISTCEVVPQLQKPDIPSESVVLNKDEVN